MIGTFVQSVVMITDMAFISDLGTIQYDAVGNAGILYMSLMMLVQGISDSSQIIIARRKGEGNYFDVGRTFRHSLIILFSFSLLIFATYLLFIDSFILETVNNSAIASNMTDFFEFRRYGVLFEALRLAMVAYYIGIGNTRVIIFATLVLSLSNVFLDYSLIYGEFGFPEMGIQGAALASTSAELISLLFMFIYILNDKKSKTYHLFERIHFDREIFQKFLKIAPPMMLQGFIALSAWYIFFSFIEELGPNELEISHVIRSLYFIAFIPMYGLNATTRTYVSSLIGAGETNKIPLFLRRVILLNLFFLILFLHGIVFYPIAMVHLVNYNSDFIMNPEYMESIRGLFRLIFGNMMLIGFAAPFFHFISGTGNTRASFLVEISAISIYLVCSYLLVYVLEAGLMGIWSVEYIYFGSMGLFSFLYFKFANWKNTTV
ncbi:MAG: MATE family efflux transporter [Crocinitomicaceae bacterium]